jgi:hypothetical protein
MIDSVHMYLGTQNNTIKYLNNKKSTFFCFYIVDCIFDASVYLVSYLNLLWQMLPHTTPLPSLCVLCRVLCCAVLCVCCAVCCVCCAVLFPKNIRNLNFNLNLAKFRKFQKLKLNWPKSKN